MFFMPAKAPRQGRNQKQVLAQLPAYMNPFFQ
jgi:hypothetical protein